MKQIIIFLIRVYQIILSPFLKSLLGTPGICRYSQSCSQFAAFTIQKKGILLGSYLSFIRILSCQPFFSKNN